MQWRLVIVAMVLVLCGAATPAVACGPRTVAVIEAYTKSGDTPRFRCGAEFNEMLARAQKKDWKGALAAYEAHLAGLGKWEAGSANASETRAYLQRMSQAR